MSSGKLSTHHLSGFEVHLAKVTLQSDERRIRDIRLMLRRLTPMSIPLNGGVLLSDNCGNFNERRALINREHWQSPDAEGEEDLLLIN